MVSRMRMIGTVQTTWTSEADELAGPSSYKYKYKYILVLLRVRNPLTRPTLSIED